MSEIITSSAPAVVGPYAQARIHGDLLFVSGQLPIDPATGQMHDDPVAQMRQVLRNLDAIATAAGTSLRQTIRTTVLVTDLSRFRDLNEFYAAAFSQPYPARTTFQVGALPMGAQVEIDAVISLKPAT